MCLLRAFESKSGVGEGGGVRWDAAKWLASEELLGRPKGDLQSTVASPPSTPAL